MENKKVRSVVQYENHFSEFLKKQPVKVQNKIFKVIEAIEFALASAYKKEFGKKGQIIKAIFNTDTGDVEFSQVKLVIESESDEE